jgi:Plavaka transposase
MTIGNIPKHIRRKPSRQAQVLLAYIPTAKLDHIQNKAARRRTQANLFHACMSYILNPLEDYGVNGFRVTGGDGAVRSVHPIFSNYVGDYPEQILVTAVKTGECPECPAPRNELGNPESVGNPRELGQILEALDSISQGPTAFANACRKAGIKPIQRPFWKNLPFVNVYRSITPDILHQLYQGVLKHVIGWLRTICGDAEIDARCRRLPPNHNIHLFLKGICHLSRITGTEHDQICRFLLGIIIDICLPNNRSPATLVKAIRGLLDFLSLARYPVHTAHTLDDLDAALKSFHDNKQIFIDLGVRANFNIPKLHYSSHYRFLIELYGTTDNYNTEYTECLHIDLAKNAYRTTNSKDEYPQMTQWLDWRERIICHDRFLFHQFNTPDTEPPPRLLIPTLVAPRQLKMSKEPSARGVSLHSLVQNYGATHFEASLSHWVIQYQNPEFTKRQIDDAAQDLDLPFNKVLVYHRIKFISTDPFSIDPTIEKTVDSITATPSKLDKYGKVIPGRFDTVLVKVQGTGGERGMLGQLISESYLC